MSFYIRKSVKIGPLRLNLSKSGIGISSGISGARISTGPRGTYINIGKKGVYYRKRIDETIFEPISETNFQDNPIGYEDLHTANIDELIESSNQELLTQINSRLEYPTFAFLIFIITIIISGSLIYSINTSYTNTTTTNIILLIIAIIVGGLGLYIAWGTHQQEVLARTTTLNYNLDEETISEFTRLQSAFNELSGTNRIWRITSRQENSEWRRNAGASSLITRTMSAVTKSSPPFLQARITVYGFFLNNMQLYFLPDQVFVFENGKYGAASYNSLRVKGNPTQYIEDNNVPNDSKIINYTWQHARIDGGPDRRFRSNRQIPIVQYYQIELNSQSGMKLQLQVSNVLLAQKFEGALFRYINFRKGTLYTDTTNKSSNNEKNNNSQAQANSKSKHQTAYTMLKIPLNASKEEITSAYKKMAQQYHPDKVAGLAPEFQDLAEKRMKEINSAYQELMSQFK